MTQLKQLAPIATQFAGQPRRAGSLCHATQDQQQLRAGATRPLQIRAGEAVEDATASSALVIDQRRPLATVNAQSVRPAAAGAGQAVGMQQKQEFVVTCLFIHEVLNWKIHRLLRERRDYFASSFVTGKGESTASAT
jgi:hypothetical protein